MKLIGVTRYEWYDLDYYKKYFPEKDIYENNFDYGLAINTEFKKFNLNFELVGRKSVSELLAGTDANGNQLYRKEEQTDLQYLGTFNYNLTDQMVLSYTLGNRFEPILNLTNSLVSTLNFGFGTPTKSNLNSLK